MTMFHISAGNEHVALRTNLPLPQPGDKLIVEHSFDTPAFRYKRGQVLELIERTQEAPHGILCSLGNWCVKCPNFTSVWSNIEWAMADGILKVI